MVVETRKPTGLKTMVVAGLPARKATKYKVESPMKEGSRKQENYTHLVRNAMCWNLSSVHETVNVGVLPAKLQKWRAKLCVI